MTREYTHKGYRLVWSDGGISYDDMASEWVYDRYGNPLMHATVRGTPPTEEQARERIELTLEILEKIVKKVEYRLLRGEE